jgi:hypothetical protein
MKGWARSLTGSSIAVIKQARSAGAKKWMDLTVAIPHLLYPTPWRCMNGPPLNYFHSFSILVGSQSLYQTQEISNSSWSVKFWPWHLLLQIKHKIKIQTAMTGIQVPTCLEALYLPAALTVLSFSLIADVASDNENRIGINGLTELNQWNWSLE